jgi:hypothetical protein
MKLQLAKAISIGCKILETHIELIGKGAFGSLFVWASSLAEGLRIERSRC